MVGWPWTFSADTTTFDQSTNFSGGGGQIFATNCIFANTTPDPGSTYAGLDNGFYNSPEFGGGTQTNTTSPFQSGIGGNYYLTPGIPFLEAGNTTADQLGLYWFTTQTNENIEGISQVDLGYHYPALDASNNPVSTLVSGVPDYLSDPSGNGLPETWESNYFGNLNELASQLDSAGNTLIDDYYNGVNPNVISFTVRLGNQHYNTTNPTGSFIVMGGYPAHSAVLVDSTNFSGAAWSNYNGSISLNLGSTDGAHEVWLGLDGGGPLSVPAWIGTTVYLDRTPPVLNITNPAPGTVMQPYIQVQGLANERLSAVSYDISNALGVVTNVAAAVTGEFLDTNLLAFTTNYFQCYDVQPTNGVNLITVHATDWAGNTASTNISYTLDYTGKTNPPAITMTWPKGGEDIAQSNITVYGTLSDPTAAILLQVTDTNGDSNMISGVVERDGHFWIQNVPLNPGTNWLSLTVQDVVSNSTTTNLIVTENNGFGMAISSVSGDPWAAFSTVSGTISDNSYSVTVNGVLATNDGSGNWIAYDVPNNPGNMAVFQVNATNSTGDPHEQWTTIKPMEITLQAATYHDDDMVPPSDPSENDATETVTTWSYTWGSGGTWNQTVNTPAYSSQSQATIMPDGSVPYMISRISANDLNLDETNEFPYTTPWAAAFPQEVGSLSVVNPSMANSWENRTAQASWLLHAGSLGVEGDLPNLMILSGSALQELQGIGIDDAGFIESGPGLLGPDITNTGQQENSGYEAYVMMADGATQQSTITSDRPLTIVSSGATDVKPSHQTACAALGNPDNSRLTIGIGEVVNLSGMPQGTEWANDGPGTLTVTGGGAGATFQASRNGESDPVITATYSNAPPYTFDFHVTPPSGVTVAVYSNNVTVFGTNEIAVRTVYSLIWQPIYVSFAYVHFRENIPSFTNTWPNGQEVYAPATIVDKGVLGCGGVMLDEQTSGPYPIYFLTNSAGKNTSYTYTEAWNDEYQGDQTDQWNVASLLTKGVTYQSDGSGQITLNGTPGNSEGPWP